MDTVLTIAKNAKAAAPFIASAGTLLKNTALSAIGQNLIRFTDKIISANQDDIKKSMEEGVSG